MEHVAKFGGDLRHKAARRKRKRIQQQNEWIDGHNNFGLEWLSISTEQIYADSTRTSVSLSIWSSESKNLPVYAF